MRCALAFALIIIFFTPGNAQDTFSFGSAENFELKILNVPADPEPPGKKMMGVGKGLTFGGIGLLGLGVMLLSTADYSAFDTNTNPGYYNSEPDMQITLGATAVVGGIGMIIPGIIFWSKGSKKYKVYQLQQSGSINFAPNEVSLRYRF